MLITNAGVYNLKDTSKVGSIQPSRGRLASKKSRLSLSAKLAPSSSSTSPTNMTTGTSFSHHRYASSDRRDNIIFSILKAARETCGIKLPIYYREELNLVHYATTKEEKKQSGVKEIKGEHIMHDDISFKRYIDGEEKEKEMVRKTTRTLYSRNNLKE